MANTEFASLFELSRAERIQLVEDLWDSIAREEAELPISDAKINELRRRKDQLSRQPDSGRTWEQVKQRARIGIRSFGSRPDSSQFKTDRCLVVQRSISCCCFAPA